MLQALPRGKRDTDYKFKGRHTEGVWAPGKRKRTLQPPRMRGGVWWTPRPTGASLRVPKRTEVGAWGRISKRSPESSSYQDPRTSFDPRIRIIRGSKDLNPWNRIIKRKADESGSSSAGGLVRIMRGSEDSNQQWERIVKRRPAGKELVKWGRIQKRDNEDIEDEEDEELEENEEEYDDEGENYFYQIL